MDETNLATNQQTTILGGLKDFILEGSEIKDSPYQLIGRSSIAAGKFWSTVSCLFFFETKLETIGNY